MQNEIDFCDASLVCIRRVTSHKDLAGFQSDVDEFNTYVGPEMDFDIQENFTVVYMITVAGHVAGYADLATAHIRHDATPKLVGMKINGNVPAFLVGRLAVDSIFQGHGVGRVLLDLIVKGVIPDIKKQAGCRYHITSKRR